MFDKIENSKSKRRNTIKLIMDKNTINNKYYQSIVDANNLIDLEKKIKLDLERYV